MKDFWRFDIPTMQQGEESGGTSGAAGAVLYIEGVIESPQPWIDWSTYTFRPPVGFREQLAVLEGSDLTVYIDSMGGDMFAGLGLYTALHERKGKTRCEVTKAFSAATLVLAGCDKGERMLSPGALLMYHNPALHGVEGDHRDLVKAAQVLEKYKGAVIGAYTESSGMDAAEVSALMDAETFYTAREAVAAGWADGVLPGTPTMQATEPVGLRAVMQESVRATEASIHAAMAAGADKEREEILAWAKRLMGREV